MTDAAAREVVVYTTPFCAPCEQLKRQLGARGIAFAVRDLLMDEAAADHLEAHNVRSTPALEVDGVLYAGDSLTTAQLDELFPR